MATVNVKIRTVPYRYLANFFTCYCFQTKLSEHQAVDDGGGGVLQPPLSSALAGQSHG